MSLRLFLLVAFMSNWIYNNRIWRNIGGFKMKKITGLILAFLLMFNSFAYANEKTEPYLNSINNEDIKSGSIGGEWLILAKSRGYNENNFEAYYSDLCNSLKEKNGDLGRKYTDYSRIIIALTAIGKNPCNVAGYDLTAKLEDYNKVTAQGLNGAIFAVIATKCGSYKNIQCENYLSLILSRQNSDGSFSLSGDGDVDITAMAIQALSFYTYRENVKLSVNKALNWLYNNTNESSESYAQTLVAYTSLDNFVDKSRINETYNNLMTFSVEGGFCHKKGEGLNQMSSEQAAYAVAAYERYNEGKSPLYNINVSKAICLK